AKLLTIGKNVIIDIGCGLSFMKYGTLFDPGFFFYSFHFLPPFLALITNNLPILNGSSRLFCNFAVGLR
ncbi:hypothetical protein, partial [Bacteroides fragilis]|uniref:hypothetical protein n=1 Tax=Bacteroides fragilis TaxID=817 RepID=UPI0022E85EE4